MYTHIYLHICVCMYMYKRNVYGAIPIFRNVGPVVVVAKVCNEFVLIVQGGHIYLIALSAICGI